MFRNAIVAIAAAGLFACAHSQEVEPVTQPQEGAVVSTEQETVATKPVRRSAPRPNADADNTAVNARDRDDKTLTPMDQGGSTQDLKITQEIRKAVVEADGLSFTAKNVKIITREANVTLRGAVKNTSEKQRIDELARACAGVGRVDNQLEVESLN